MTIAVDLGRKATKQTNKQTGRPTILVTNSKFLSVSNCLSGAPALVSEMIDSCVLRVGGSMHPFLSCDRTKHVIVMIPILVFTQLKTLLSLSVLRMSALKYQFFGSFIHVGISNLNI